MKLSKLLRKIEFFLVDSRKKRNFATNKNKGD